MTKPLHYGINHDKFRPGQLESIEFAMNSKQQMVFITAPVGCGKSAVAAGIGWDGRTVRVLTKTKSLQAQYRDYGFEVLYGLANYPCAYFPMFNAQYCGFADNMYGCPKSSSCEYLRQRTATKQHNRQALSYAYYLQAHWPKENPTDYLYCDEAHELPNIVMGHMALKLTLDDIIKLEIERWPIKFDLPSQTLQKRVIASWLANCLVDLEIQIEKYSAIKNSPQLSRKVSFLTATRRKFAHITDALTRTPSAFLVSVGRNELEITPLTARFDFKYLFDTESKMILTSATIGNPNEFAYSLGINKFDFRDVPSNFPPESMPIFVPNGIPRISYSMTDAARKKQIDAIYKLIVDCDPSWNGLIHTSSKW